MRGRAIAGGSALLAALTGVVAAVSVAESSPSSQPPPHAGAPLAKVAAASERQRAGLRAFGRPARAHDRLPEPARANIERIAAFGENPDLARQVLRMPSGHRLFMVPAAGDLVGIYDEAGGGGVTDLAHIAAGESHGLDICAPFLAPGWLRYYGELPSDAMDVELVAADGSKHAPVLGENAWALEISATPARRLPTELRFSSAGSRRVVALHTPDDVGSGGCHRSVDRAG